MQSRGAKPLQPYNDSNGVQTSYRPSRFGGGPGFASHIRPRSRFAPRSRRSPSRTGHRAGSHVPG